MSKISQREKDEAYEQKIQMHIEANGQCYHCRAKITIGEAQLAHRIPAWKANIKKYGRPLIFHLDNMDITCPDCNSKSNLNPASNPVAVEELVIKIRKKLLEEARD